MVPNAFICTRSVMVITLPWNARDVGFESHRILEFVSCIFHTFSYVNMFMKLISNFSFH